MAACASGESAFFAALLAVLDGGLCDCMPGIVRLAHTYTVLSFSMAASVPSVSKCCISTSTIIAPNLRLCTIALARELMTLS